MSQRNSILDFISRLISAFSGKPATSQPQPPPPPAVEEEFVSVVHPRVLVINFDPVVDAQGTHLTQRMNWNNVDDLIAGCIADHLMFVTEGKQGIAHRVLQGVWLWNVVIIPLGGCRLLPGPARLRVRGGRAAHAEMRERPR